MYNEKEKAKLMETERKRSVKPPLRYLPDDERNQLLNVRGSFIFYSSVKNRDVVFGDGERRGFVTVTVF